MSRVLGGWLQAALGGRLTEGKTLISGLCQEASKSPFSFCL